MSLVFGAILLLWGLIAVLVRLLPEVAGLETEALEPGDAEFSLPEHMLPAPPENVTQNQPVLSETAPPEKLDPALAAAASVAVALAFAAQRSETNYQPALPYLQPVSAWQTVMRSHILNKRGSVR